MFNFSKTRLLGIAGIFLGALCFSPAAHAAVATTTVTISVCGDGIFTSPPETCDNGVLNSDAYSTSISGRTCRTDCSGFGPYCGDGILQAASGEECDDGNNTAGDRCDAICKIEQNVNVGCCPGAGPGPAGGGTGPFNPGSDVPPVPTKVAIYGKAYADADVHILKDGETIGVVHTDSLANFYFATTDVTPGISTFAFWAQDRNKIKSISYTLTFRVVPNAVTTVTGAYIPPTISLDKKKVNRGDMVKIFGETVPDATVEAHVNSEQEFVRSAPATHAGDWQILFDTTPLENENFHTARAVFRTGTSSDSLKSSFSESAEFYVGNGEGIDTKSRSDINRDGSVDFVDFSILIFYWNTDNGDADINLDGKVNLVDFSLLIFNWTG